MKGEDKLFNELKKDIEATKYKSVRYKPTKAADEIERLLN